VQQCANIFLRDAPIFARSPLSRLVVKSSAQPLKCVGKTERISSQIFIDLFFNQDVAMRTTRFRQNTKSGQARPESMHFSLCESPLSHGQGLLIDRVGDG
jgi:hypothetical protein